jgi:hypothetical protein
LYAPERGLLVLQASLPTAPATIAKATTQAAVSSAAAEAEAATQATVAAAPAASCGWMSGSLLLLTL